PPHAVTALHVGTAPMSAAHQLVVDDRLTGADHGPQLGQHRLGGAAPDRDVTLPVDVEAVELAVLVGDGPPERRRSPGHRILVEVALERLVSSVDELARWRKVRHALREVHATELVHHARHLTDHRLREPLHPPRYPIAAHARHVLGDVMTTT